MKYLKNKEEAEDATCEIFQSLFVKLKKHEVKHFRSWIYQTSRNHCLMIIRSAKGKRQVELNGHEKAEEVNGMEIVRLQEQKLDLLEACMAELKSAQKDCIRLFYLESKSYAEVAEEQGMELKKVKSHIQNGKRNLRRLLEQHKEFNGNS